MRQNPNEKYLDKTFSLWATEVTLITFTCDIERKILCYFEVFLYDCGG